MGNSHLEPKTVEYILMERRCAALGGGICG